MGIRQTDQFVLHFGAFEADLYTGELRKGGKLIPVPPQPFKVLVLLASQPGELVTRDEIQRELWGGHTFVDFEQGLNFCVKRLRAALGDDAENPRYIETLPRRGYRFIAEVEKRQPRDSAATPRVMARTVPSPEMVSRDSATFQAPVAYPKPPTGVWTQGSAALRPRTQSAAVAEHPAHHIPTSTRRWWNNRRAIIAWSTLAAVLVFLSGYLVRLERPQKLTQQDTIVLAGFINNTGEAVFTGTLQEGLRRDLEQSTFLNILSDDAVTTQLRYMGQSSEPLTFTLAREVCRRQGSKAVLSGSIVRIGNRYPITLKAVSCADGRSLDVEQVEAASREDVLSKLHEAGSQLRRKLGESLASVQKYDAPLEQATTPSLEALQALGVAYATWRSKGDEAAIPLFKRAIELDPNFALAYSDLGTVYCNIGEALLCTGSVDKAHQLRERVSERERMLIDSNYYLYVTGELEKAEQVFETWMQIYPRSGGPYVQSGLVSFELGRLQNALNDELQAFRLMQGNQVVYQNVSFGYMYLNRWDDANAILQEAHARKLDEPLLENSYQLAFLLNDSKEMERCLAAAKGKSDVESSLLASQADSEAFHGRLRRAREFSRQAVASALAGDSKETAAEWRVTEALREAEFENRVEAERDAVAALSLSPTKDIQTAAALALARTGRLEQARSIANDLQKRFPTDTLINNYWLPSIRSAIQISQKNFALAVETLQLAQPYELGGNEPPFTSGATLYPVYLRGQAYLEMKQWGKAAAEFQRIQDHRGLVWNFPLGALAYLELARAYGHTGDLLKARAAYQDFLSLWQGADAEIPVLEQAKSEYAKLLKSPTQ
jgi:eukaryotic-like serine/threonine-protein kinase